MELSFKLIGLELDPKKALVTLRLQNINLPATTLEEITVNPMDMQSMMTYAVQIQKQMLAQNNPMFTDPTISRLVLHQDEYDEMGKPTVGDILDFTFKGDPSC